MQVIERMSQSMKSTLVLAFMAVIGSGVSFGQNEEDAIRMSSIMPGGTARSAGMANAFGALGADGSSISINPAGFGVYRTSELSFTPSLEVNDASSLYYGNRAADTRTRFNFSNLTLAINSPSRKDGDWKSSTYGIVFDRQATHNYRHQAINDRVPGSILHHFHNEATADPTVDYTTAFPFTSTLAWETFGLDSMGGMLAPAIPFGGYTAQTHTRETRGAHSNTSFFYSGNYKDKLYIGVSLGIVGHRFRRVTTHAETNLAIDSVYPIESLTYKETLSTTGNGFDVKFGVIGRITEKFRVGASFHSPQWLQFNDGYIMEMTTDFSTPDNNGNFNYSSISPDGVFSYRLNTPWKLVGSAAYIASTNGLFSVDYEYSDPSRMRFQPSSRISDTYDFRFENEVIKDVFQPVHTVRVGTEWRTGAWYYRLGWGYTTDPYIDTDPRHGSAFRNYAIGIGYRTDHVGVDLGFNFNQRSTAYFPYGQDLVEPITADLSTYRTLVTVSFRP